MKDEVTGYRKDEVIGDREDEVTGYIKMNKQEIGKMK